MKKIKLTQGKVMLVDDEDYDELSRDKWQADGSGNLWYATRREKHGESYRKIYAHRVVMNVPKGVSVDHKNHNGLDIRKSNLRLATQAQNMHNTRAHKDARSKYKGVSWCKQMKKWQACICLHYKQMGLGFYHNEIEAARAYDKKAIELFGEFVYPNFRKKKYDS